MKKIFKVSCFFLFPITLFVFSYETRVLVFLGSIIPFYILYLLVTMKASEFSAESNNSTIFLLLLISHIATSVLYGVTGLIGLLLYILFHLINKRSITDVGRLARLTYGASYVAGKATGEDSQELSNYDIAITITSLAAAFAFYFTHTMLDL